MNNLQALMQTQSVPGQQRQSALLLHALHPEDRAWLLSQLDAVASQELTVLLEELQALGIPSDPALVAEATAAASALVPEAPLKSFVAPDVAPSASPIEDTPVLRLQRLDPLATPTQWPLLVSCFQHEPVRLCARLLLLDTWPWQDALLAELGAARRAQITDELEALQSQSEGAATRTAPRLQAQLLHHLDQHLQPRADFRAQREAAPAQGAHAHSFGAGWLRRASQWLVTPRSPGARA